MRRWIPLGCSAAAFLLLIACTEEVEIHLLGQDHPTAPGAVEVRGIAREEREAGSETGEFPFTVHTEAGLAGGHPPVLGEIRLAGNSLRFHPAFPFAPGQRYIARWQGASPAEALLVLPAETPESTTKVVAIHPSSLTLPANVLRLYLHFSHPMTRGEARHHIRLLHLTDAGEEPVVAPFVAPEEELWDLDGKRLTLLFDPGRIKQGVGPHQERGAVLTAGERYRLEVADAWKDHRGAPLTAPFSYSFTVVAEDREPPDPGQWRLLPPTEDRRPLRLEIPHALDHALALSALGIVNPAGEALEGKSTFSGEDPWVWEFVPEGPWARGEHEVRILPILEDPSGNRVGRPFDAPLEAAGPAAPPREVRLPFIWPP